jgi:hypothetical protein
LVDDNGGVMLSQAMPADADEDWVISAVKNSIPADRRPTARTVP